MDDDCNFTTELHYSVLLQSVRWIQIIVTLSSIVVLLFASRNLSRTIFDSITILFIKILFTIIVLYSFGYGVAQVVHVTAKNIAVSPCNSLFPKFLCLFRSGSAIVGVSFVPIHTSITIQQFLSTFRYSVRVKKGVARLTILITICYVTLYGFLSLHNESFEGVTQICTSNKDSEIITIVNMNIMMVMNVINSIGAVFLLRHNKKILSNGRNSFELLSKFKRVQNVYAIRQFLPLIVLQSISHFIHFCLYSFTFYYRPNYTRAQFTILYSVVNVVPFYCLFSPLTFLILTKLGRFRRIDHVKNMIASVHKSKTQDIYFKNLTASWNAPN